MVKWYIDDETRRSGPNTLTVSTWPASLHKLKLQVCETMGLRSNEWYISNHARQQATLNAGCWDIQVNLAVRGVGGGYDYTNRPIDLITFDRDTPTIFAAEEHATVPATMVEQARSTLSAAAIRKPPDLLSSCH